MTIEFEEEGFDELANRMSRADTMTKIALNDGLRKIGKLFVPTKGTGPLAEETPKRTGKLRRSTYFMIETEQGGQRLEIRQPAKTPAGMFYGFWVREGTIGKMPDTIYPKTAKALRFEIDGHIIFAKHVHPKGQKANPYHRRVFQRLLPNVNNIVKEMGGFMTAYLSGEGEQIA